MYMLCYRILVNFFCSNAGSISLLFYVCMHVGIVLVHDLTNRKSHQNLRKWLAEILNKDTLRSQGNG